MIEIVPTNSRYIPLTQQAACCVPTCFQMIMLKHNVHLKPAEEIGYYMGLVVHPDRKNLFYNVRTSLKKPMSGYGTQTTKSKFEINKALKKLEIPLSVKKNLINNFLTSIEIYNYLKSTELKNQDVLLCFNHGVLIDNPKFDWGHVCVFDRLIDGKIRLIDPSEDQPKWKLVSVEKMFEAMKKHGQKNSAGFWEVSVIRLDPCLPAFAQGYGR